MTPRTLLTIACIIAAVVLLHRLGDVPLGGDDCYYAQVAKEMSASGDLLTPRNGGHPDFHTSKPPVLFWMNIVSGRLLGFTTAAMRLPSALLGLLGIVCTALFAARYLHPGAGFFAALILTFTQQYLYHARSCVTDGPFAVFFGLALMAFWAARSGRRPVWFYVFGLCAGLAVMTRQLPGFFVFAAVGVYILAAREWWILRSPHWWGGVAVVCAVIVPWHAVMYLRYGTEFLRSYFGVSLMTAFSGYPAGYSSSPSLNPWYAYGAILLSNYWPWLPLLGYGVYRSLRSCRDPFVLFLLCWAFVPLALFQAAKVKQYHYIVPLYIPFALITASVIAGWSDRARAIAARILLPLTGGLVLAYLFFPIVPRTLDSREFVDTIRLVPAARAAAGDIHVLPVWSSHYNNCLMFYADKRVVRLEEDALVARFAAAEPAAFALERSAYERVSRRLDAGRVRILAESEHSVLFENTL